MSVDILLAVISAILSLTAGGLVSNKVGREIAEQILKLFGVERPEKNLSYSEKLTKLTDNLANASREVDNVLSELSQIAQDREKAVQKVEADLQKLQDREKELQERIETLQNVPLPVAEHFAKLTTPSEKKSARRDYLLFGAGVIVSTVIAIVLKLLGLG